MNQLSIGSIISNAIQLGIKNMASIVGAVVLWLLTLWIPYINVGTTIAILGLAVAISKGKVISPTEIFNPKYRRNMGEFFLLIGFMYIGIVAGTLFLFIPGIVIGTAWSLAPYLLIDKNLNPTEAISVSNRITYGKKWTIFLANLILSVIMIIAILILAGIFNMISDILAGLVILIAYIAYLSIMLSATAYIYGQLSENVKEEE